MADDTTPTPEYDERSAPFFEAAARGVLALQRCEACGAFLHPVRTRCTRCGDARVVWAEASGHGRVWSHGKLRRVFQPEHEGHLPIELVWVELDEGVRFASRRVHGDDTDLRTGDRVSVDFERLADGTPVPVFRRAL